MSLNVFKSVVYKGSQVVSFVTTQVKHNKPKIYIAGGLALTAVAVISALVKAEDFTEEQDRHEEVIFGIKHDKEEKFIEEKVAKREMMAENIHHIANVAIISAIPLLCESAGIYSVCKGLELIKNEKELILAALGTAIASQQTILARVEERYGPEERKAIESNSFSSLISAYNDETGEFTKEKFDQINSEEEVLPDYRIIISEKTVIPGSRTAENLKDKTYMAEELVLGQAFANRELQRKGYIFEDEICDFFDVIPNATHRLAGNCLPDPHHPLPGDENRAGFVSFGVDEFIKAVKNGEDISYEKVIVLTPNIDGLIWNDYYKYNRNSVFGSWESTEITSE